MNLDDPAGYVLTGRATEHLAKIAVDRSWPTARVGDTP